MLVPQRYSERLGLIEPEQLEAVAARLDLGAILDAYPAPGGPFAQNLVLETTRGRFALRGNPRGLVQLLKERRVAAFLHGRSSLPVPWPYRVCDETETFGWPYAIVPWLPGEPGAELWSAAGESERVALARASGDGLTRLHEATAESFGPYDAQLDEFIEVDEFADWFGYRLDHWRRACRSVNALSTQAERYIDDELERSEDALREPFNPVLVHHDFTVDNLSFERTGDGFEAAGVFDLFEAFLGDGEEDLVRMLRWLDTDDERAAFVGAYAASIPLGPRAGERLAVYALADFLVAWEHDIKVGSADDEASFVESARPVVERARALGEAFEG